MGRVLVTRRLPDGGLDPLGPDHEIVGPKPDDTPYTHDELRAFAGECDAIVSLLTDRIDADVLDAGAQGGRLRVVANVAVGYDNIDVAGRGRTRHHRVQHAGRARRDDRRHRVPADPRRVAARVHRRSRPAHRALGGLGHHAVPRARRARRDARHRRFRAHRPCRGAARRGLRDAGAAPRPRPPPT